MDRVRVFFINKLNFDRMPVIRIAFITKIEHMWPGVIFFMKKGNITLPYPGGRDAIAYQIDQ